MEEQKTQAGINSSIGRDLLNIKDNMVWMDGVVLDQLTLRRQVDCWEVRMKGARSGRPFTGMFTMETYEDALMMLAECTSKGTFTWASDKWPSKHLRESGTLKKSKGENSLRFHY